MSFADNGGHHPTVPHFPSRLLSFPLRSYHKPPYVKTLSFCVRAWAPSYYNELVVEPGAPSFPPPRNGDPAFIYWCRAGPMAQGVFYVQSEPANLYIRNIIPLRIRLPRQRSWLYRGGAMLNFAITEFSEVGIAPVRCRGFSYVACRRFIARRT